jgi:hypothetical protein
MGGISMPAVIYSSKKTTICNHMPRNSLRSNKSQSVPAATKRDGIGKIELAGTKRND